MKLNGNEIKQTLTYIEACYYREAIITLKKSGYNGITIYNHLLSLSIELYIKSILQYKDIDYKKEHDIKKLYGLLPEEYKNIIEDKLKPSISIKTNEGIRYYENINVLLDKIKMCYFDSGYVTEKYINNKSIINCYQELVLLADILYDITYEITNSIK